MEYIDWTDLIGKLAGILIFASYLRYIQAILKGTTKPNRATWFMLAVISSVIAFSYAAVGAEDTLWVAIGAALGTTIIALLTIKYHSEGGGLIDLVCVASAGICLLLYFQVSNPLTVLVVSLAMDFAALLPTIRHAQKKPHEEDALAWMMTVSADLLAITVIETWNLEIALYPCYMALINGIVLFYILRPRTQKARGRI